MVDGPDAIFTLIGAVPVVPDRPCFCTPLYRNDNGDKYYIQCEDNGVISDFVLLRKAMRPGEFLEYRGNNVVRLGRGVQAGFRDSHGTLFVEERAQLIARLIDTIEEYKKFPFLYLHIARLSGQAALFERACDLDGVREAIDQGTIDVAAIAPPSQNWTVERVEKLKELWAQGLSASQIAAQLGGVSRNALIGKVHRLGLKGRAREGGIATPLSGRKPRR